MYYQGEPGAFSEAAMRHYFPKADPRGLSSFAEVYGRLRADRKAAALLPIENAYRGPVVEVWDRLLEDLSLSIWGEVVEPVPLALMAPLGESLESITRVRSHPQALMQSRGYWEPRGYRAEPSLDTAGSAREVAENRWPGVAAIAHPAAAARYGLHILAEPLQDYPDNRTRFWLISQTEPSVDAPARLAAKAALALDIAHEPGSLVETLMIFSRRRINLTKIESRPRPGVPFEFRFWIEVSIGQTGSDEWDEVFDELQDRGLYHRLLGHFPVYSL